MNSLMLMMNVLNYEMLSYFDMIGMRMKISLFLNLVVCRMCCLSVCVGCWCDVF